MITIAIFVKLFSIARLWW